MEAKTTTEKCTDRFLRVDHGHDKRKECQLRVSATALHSIRVCGPAEIDCHTFQHA